jgi:ferredoxin-type protein NapG
MIDPIQQPCWMCADFPCIAACEPRVLQLGLPKRMATARIESFSCLAWQGSFCTVCLEQCPVPDAIVLEGGKPRIVEPVCTGCGVCQYVCPAPENAILLLPLAERPSSEETEVSGDGTT